MDNLTKYNNAFIATFNVESEKLNDDFSSESVSNWDSVTQLALVTAVEDEFDLMLDTEDILGFKSYKIGKEILKKNNIEI